MTTQPLDHSKSHENNELDQLLPLSPYVFQILVALAGGAKHGYGIMTDVRERTRGSVRIGTGTLYTAIKRLLNHGWITEVTASAESRREYRLTELGDAVARAEARRLETMLELARERRLLDRKSTV